MRSVKTLAAALLVAMTACRAVQTPAPGDGSFVVSDRLSNQQVNAFTQDRLGQIWIATSRGLNKYTMHEYQQFLATGDSLDLPDNRVNDVLCASDGSLWVATLAGAAILTEDGHFRRVNADMWAANFSLILEPQPGQILFFNGAALYRYEPGTHTLVSVAQDLNAFGYPSIVTDDSSLWFLSDNGWSLKRLSKDSFELIQTIHLPHQVYHICDAGRGEIWMSGMGSMSILDKTALSWKSVPRAIRACDEIMKGDVDLIYAVDEDCVLLSVIGKGIFGYWRSQDAVRFQNDNGFPFDIPNAEIRTIFRDSDNNLWFGTATDGFSVSYRYKERFNINKFLTDALKHKSVTSLCIDNTDKLWITTYRDGLFVYDSISLTEVDVTSLIEDKNVGYIRCSRVFCDSRGDLWLLFPDKYRVIRCRWNGRKLIKKNEFFMVSPTSVAEDDHGNIWVGGMGGALLKFDGREPLFVQLPVPGGWTFVTDIIPWKPGYMLAASFGNVPFAVNTYTDEAEALPVSDEDRAACFPRGMIIPTCLFRDSSGDVWMGTTGSGLVRFGRDGRTARVPGTPCEDICAVTEDGEGKIWVSTLNGLGRLNRDDGRFVSYYEPDGTGGNQFSDRAVCVSAGGVLLLGGTHGITSFTPSELTDRRSIPLVFQYLRVHNRLVQPGPDAPVSKALPYGPEITLRHDQAPFSIAFAALDYGEYTRVHYRYKMDGFDHDWVESGTGHEAYYNSLPAGRYRFRVGIDADNAVAEEQALSVSILPPWYSTWWAIAIWILIGLAITWTGFFFWARIRKARMEAAERDIEVKREKELNRIQMNYFSNVAHEFRTPLTMIAGPAQQLSESQDLPAPDKQLVDIIRRNSAWMLSLVGQLLDFNRIGNRKLQIKVAQTDIVGPLNDIAGLFRFNAQSKGIELSTYGLEDAFTMWVDADKVQKIVMNLLSNALKFTPKGGKVSLSFDVITRKDAAALFPLGEADTDSRYALIRVSDTGPGIPEDEMEKIFERFYQGHSGSNTHGSGIGLYYARVLCGLHHGYIKPGNRPEGGAEFSVILPVSASSYTEDERVDQAPELQLHAVAESLPAEDMPAEGERKHIAVVDDDIDIANYIKVMLQPKYKVSMYFDAASALKGMEEDVPDAVISDVVMPGMSGYELCSEIKGNLQLSHIPVVLVTAKVAVENQVQGLHKGADAYVTKPFQPAYLQALVHSLLENRDKLRRQLGSATTTEDLNPEALSPRDAAFMKELYALMEKELANSDIDIVHMCEKMKISRTKFYYKVKGLTGENPSVFFKRYKLNRAAALLKEGTHNMSEIAWMTGFGSLSHFSTSFKKQFGVPPSEYMG